MQPVVNSSTWEVKSWSLSQSNSKRGNWDASNMQLFPCIITEIGRANQLFRGCPSAGCRGHVHWLAHGIGNHAEIHGWPWARYSALHYWTRSELLTETVSAFKSLFTVQKQLNCCLFQTLCTHFIQLQTHRLAWIARYELKTWSSMFFSPCHRREELIATPYIHNKSSFENVYKCGFNHITWSGE